MSNRYTVKDKAGKIRTIEKKDDGFVVVDDEIIIGTTPKDDNELMGFIEEVDNIKNKSSFDLEVGLSYVLISGVILSLALILIGLVDYAIINKNINLQGISPFQASNFFVLTENVVRAVSSGKITPVHIISLGIIVLMLTPYVRVLSSWVYFLFAEKNILYTLITTWVLAILTISLFLK